MSNSWRNYTTKDYRGDGDRKARNKRPERINKSEQRRKERALKTGDVSVLLDDEPEDDIGFDDRETDYYSSR